MVVRSSLGMEIPSEKVFIAQKWMIEKANVAAKPVITASQILESMISAPRPTRAEASDASNAVMDGTDCIMLQGASANGTYPVEAVTELARLAAEAEKTLDYKNLFDQLRSFTPAPVATAESVASGAVGSVNELQVRLIIVVTDTGRLACSHGQVPPMRAHLGNQRCEPRRASVESMQRSYQLQDELVPGI